MTQKEIKDELEILRPRLKRTTGSEFINVAKRINELEAILTEMDAENNRPIEIDTFDIDEYVMGVDFSKMKADPTEHKFTSSLYRDDKDNRTMPAHPIVGLFPSITSIY